MKKHTPQKDQEKDATVRDEKSEHTSQKNQEEYATQWQGYVSLTLALITSLVCWSWLYAFFNRNSSRIEIEQIVVIFGPFVMLVGGPLCAIFGIAAFKTNHPPTRWLILLASLGPPVVFLGLFVCFAFFCRPVEASAEFWSDRCRTLLSVVHNRG